MNRVVLALMGLLALLGLSALPQQSPVGYISRQAYFQLELLYGREPVEVVLARGDFEGKEALNLARVQKMKDFGAEIGLAHTSNYSSINPTFRRKIWNVSAAEPLRFRNVKMWFPIVGSMPYLGFFRKRDAQQRVRAWKQRGLDVYMRTAGAYSTLGWFEDPVMPNMLKWRESSLADTILHELTHATLWIPGSVQFNESFANFVGNEAAHRYMIHTYGEGSDELEAYEARKEDYRLYRSLLRDVYFELDHVYDSEHPDGIKLREKHRVLAELPSRVEQLDFTSNKNRTRYLKSVRSGKWNNARLLQYKTYNRRREWFQVILDQEEGDIGRFVQRIGEITEGSRRPWRAVRRAAGIPDSEAPPDE